MDRCPHDARTKMGARRGKGVIPLPWPLRPVGLAVHRRHALTYGMESGDVKVFGNLDDWICAPRVSQLFRSKNLSMMVFNATRPSLVNIGSGLSVSRNIDSKTISKSRLIHLQMKALNHVLFPT